MAGCQCHERLALAVVERVLDHKKRTRRLLNGDREVRFNLKWRTGAQNIDLSFDHLCRVLQAAQLEIGSRVRRVDQHAKRRGSRNKLVQKLQTLGFQFRPKQAHACNVAPGSIKARDDPGHDWIAGADKDNRNLRGCRLGHRCHRGIGGDHSHFATDKIGSHCWEVIVPAPGPLEIHRDVFTFGVTAFIESLEEPRHVHGVSVW